MPPRPRIRIPLWAAGAAALAAFVVRSVMRGFDFTPDLPEDVVVVLALGVVIALVAWVRADDARRDSIEGQDSVDEQHDKDPEP